MQPEMGNAVKSTIGFGKMVYNSVSLSIQLLPMPLVVVAVNITEYGIAEEVLFTGNCTCGFKLLAFVNPTPEGLADHVQLVLVWIAVVLLAKMVAGPHLINGSVNEAKGLLLRVVFLVILSLQPFVFVSINLMRNKAVSAL